MASPESAEQDAGAESVEPNLNDLLERGHAAFGAENFEEANERFASAARLDRVLPEPEGTSGEAILERRVRLYEEWCQTLEKLGSTEQAGWQGGAAVGALLKWAHLLVERGDANGALARMKDAEAFRKPDS